MGFRHKEGEEEMMYVKCNGCQINDGCMVHNLKPPTFTYSHGLDYADEVKKIDENKSWKEFLLWANFITPSTRAVTDNDYYGLKEYEKIGLLIEFLKSRNWNQSASFDMNWLTVDWLEKQVKSLKPKEDSEIEKLAEELRIESNSYRDYQGKDYWPRIAKKAIEIIRGEK